MNPVGASLLAALVALTGCAMSDGPQASSVASEAASYDQGLAESGREVAVQHCAGCHAIDVGQHSPQAEAPPFPGILARYNSDRLAEDLIEGVRVGHDQMPVFDLDVRSADAIIAYLKRLDSPTPVRSR